VTSNERLRAIPEVPTTVELGFEALVAYATSAMRVVKSANIQP
jgi:tripartite-type tricarboxylate transporter receptor subunit TctC